MPRCIIMSWRFSLVGDSVIDGSVPGCDSMTSGLLVYMFSVNVLNLRTLNDYHSMITDCMVYGMVYLFFRDSTK